MKLEKNLLVFCEKHSGRWVRIVKGAEINFRYGNKNPTTLKDLKKYNWVECSMDCSANDIMVIYDEYDEYKMEGGGGVITL